MSSEDSESGDFVQHRSRRMMSYAVYRKLKAVVDSWEREDRGKARVAAAALYGLVVWLVLLGASALMLPAYALLISIAGFLVWIGFVAVLIRRHLGTPQGRP